MERDNIGRSIEFMIEALMVLVSIPDTKRFPTGCPILQK